MYARNEQGFGIVEIFIIIVAIGIVAVVGIAYLNRSQPDDAQKKATSTEKSLSTYEKKTLGSQWATHTDDEYKFSVAYPNDASVRVSKVTISELDEAARRDGHQVLIVKPGAQALDLIAKIQVTHQTLEEALKNKKRIVNDNEDQAITERITEEKSIDFRGYKAIQLDIMQQHQVSKTKGGMAEPNAYYTVVFIEANDMVYAFSVDPNNKNTFDSPSVKGIYESLVIN